MISYKLARDEHFDELLEIIFHQKDPYLKPILDLIQITWDQFGKLFRTTGMVYRILLDDSLAGLCWVEICHRILRLHGLILKTAFQGRGIGVQTLDWLEDTFQNDIDEIELIVHASNTRAIAVYERCGYKTLGVIDQSGFYTMQKRVRESEQLSCAVA